MPSASNGGPQPRVVALWRFDLDHLGAMVGEHLAAIGPAQHPRQIDDFQALQGTGHAFLSSVLPTLCGL
jgi:hypothetical protein